MQIQWCEGAVLRRAETVLQGTTQDILGAEIEYGKKVSRRLWLKELEEGIGLTARHRDTERPEGRRVFEWERVVSCRNADPWWRTKLDLGSGEPFDDLHWSSTLGTAIKIPSVLGGGSVFFGKRLLCRTQQLEA